MLAVRTHGAKPIQLALFDGRGRDSAKDGAGVLVLESRDELVAFELGSGSSDAADEEHALGASDEGVARVLIAPAVAEVIGLAVLAVDAATGLHLGRDLLDGDGLGVRERAALEQLVAAATELGDALFEVLEARCGDAEELAVLGALRLVVVFQLQGADVGALGGGADHRGLLSPRGSCGGFSG